MAESSRALGSEPLSCNHPHWGNFSGLRPPLLLPTPIFPPDSCCHSPTRGRMASTPRPPGSQPEVTGFPRAHLAMWSHFCFSRVAGGSGEQGGACVRAKSLSFSLTLCSPMDRTATWEARVEHREAAATGSSDGGQAVLPKPTGCLGLTPQTVSGHMIVGRGAQ